MESMMDRKLPEAITASKDFSELTARQRKGFEANLAYIDRIVNDIDEWLAQDRPELTPKHFFDELELDVLTVQSLPDTDKGISTWLIHSTWTQEVTGQALGHQLSSEIMMTINLPPPQIEADHRDYKQWLQGQGKALKLCLNIFYSGLNFNSALAHLIASDAILANILTGLTRFRLSCN